MGMDTGSKLAASGGVKLAVRRAGESEDAFETIVNQLDEATDPVLVDPAEISASQILAEGLPRVGLPGEVNRWRRSNMPNLARGVVRVLAARQLGVPHAYGAVRLGVQRADGVILPYGLGSLRVVTTVAANTIAGAFYNTGDPLNAFRYHAIGTDNTPESVGDTALGAEVETRDNGGPHGAGGSPNIFQTVGNFTASATRAIVEHGVFTAATLGDLLDRSVFAVVNLNNLDTLQTTYELTVNAGG